MRRERRLVPTNDYRTQQTDSDINESKTNRGNETQRGLLNTLGETQLTNRSQNIEMTEMSMKEPTEFDYSGKKF